VDELLTRVRAALRRATPAADQLETDPAHPKHLLTEPGMGYRSNP
jgi:hypothetical protein